MPLHGQHPCSSCPFRQDLSEGAFEPAKLDATIGENLRGQKYVHRCHKTLDQKRENLCVGFLRHIRDHRIPNQLATLGQRMGVIDYSRISDSVHIAGSWPEVLQNHERALRGTS